MQRRYIPSDGRRGAAIVWVAIVLIVVFAFTAFTVDVGYLAITKGELQNAADASAIGSVAKLGDGEADVRLEAKRIAAANNAGEQSVTLSDADIQLGKYDLSSQTFTTPSLEPNAVRVTAWRRDTPMIFGTVLGHKSQDQKATALAMLNPRDIVFVVDLSGSMNDDTEPGWATDAINTLYSSSGYGAIGSTLMQDIFDDFGYGTFPGTVATIGAPLGVADDAYSYAEMTKDDGPLTSLTIAATYRIANTDSEDIRKEKAYRWLIDNQIAPTMPAALPVPDSAVNYDYWAAYLDYLMEGAMIGTAPPPPPPGGGTTSGGSGGSTGGGGSGPTPAPPPTVGQLNPNPFDLLSSQRQSGIMLAAATNSFDPAMYRTAPTKGTPRNGVSDNWEYLPRIYTSNRIWYFNNPSKAFSGATWPYMWMNRIGYVTYVQFMMDFGRERSPDVDNATNADLMLGIKTPLSVHSPDCPRHPEIVAGKTFSFPPRTQPMHALRRALIAGIDLVKRRNSGLTSGDRVSIVTFDAQDMYHGSKVFLPLTSDYNVAMNACTNLQASADIGATTATDSGLILARTHLTTKTSANNPGNVAAGPQGRSFAKKVVILVTDGLPNAWDSDPDELNGYVNKIKHPDFYDAGYDWFNSVLVQGSKFLLDDKGEMYSVGMGLGTDYDFMDRLARIAGTASGGQSPRGSGNPAEYESRLIDMLSDIVKNAGGRLME